MQGDGQMPTDPFEMIYDRVIKEIENLMESAKLVLGLPHGNKNFAQSKYPPVTDLQTPMTDGRPCPLS